MAKPTRLTPDVQTQICNYCAAGAPLPYACSAAGIPWPTCKVWLKRGRAGEQPYAAFVAAWQRAKAAWVAGSVLRVTKAADKDWRAAAWLLERRVAEFQPRAKHQMEHSGPGGGPIEVAPPIPRREAMEELRKLMADNPEVAMALQEAADRKP